MSKDALPFGLKIHPKEALDAIRLLGRYLEERAALITDKKIPDIPNAIKLMEAMHTFKDAVQSAVKTPAEAVYDSLRFTYIPTMMDEEGITTIGVDGIGKVHLQDDISVKVENKEELNGWLTENDLEDIITETVNAQTLAATLRQRMKENSERIRKAKGVDAPELLPLPPPEVVKVTPVVRAVLTRSK